MATTWSPTSWQAFPAHQQPDWPDQGALDRALKQISSYPPLVFAGEARSLQSSLAQVAAGNAFLLQAGDCAESFEEFSANNIREKLRVILQMAVILTYSAGVPVVAPQRVAVLGPQGTFCEQAAIEFFGSAANLIYCANFDEVFQRVNQARESEADVEIAHPRGVAGGETERLLGR